MADGYWRYADPRHQPAMAPLQTAAPLKRPRPDYPDVPAGPEMLVYYTPRDEERAAHRSVRDTETINASYDRYLRNGVSSFGPSDPVRPVPGVMTGRPVDDSRLMGVGGMDGRTGYGSGRPEPPLPPDASNTLYVEGLPANCTRREVSHIFRPFMGFREVRLVNKGSRHTGGDPLVLCFVDFATANQATVAFDALQAHDCCSEQKHIASASHLKVDWQNMGKARRRSIMPTCLGASIIKKWGERGDLFISFTQTSKMLQLKCSKQAPRIWLMKSIISICHRASLLYVKGPWFVVAGDCKCKICLRAVRTHLEKFCWKNLHCFALICISWVKRS